MAEVKNGLYFEEDSTISYYSNGKLYYIGVVQSKATGELYYINSTGKAVKGCKYGISASKTNSLIDADIHTIDKYGIIIIPEEFADGLCFWTEGEYTFEWGSSSKLSVQDTDIVYLVNNTPTKQGVVRHKLTSDLYYINTNYKAGKNAKYGISVSYTNGLVDTGIYEIDKYGVIFIPKTLDDGVHKLTESYTYRTSDGKYHTCNVGDIVYISNGQPIFAGVTKYVDEEGIEHLVYINSTKKAIIGPCKYGIPISKTNGRIDAGIYEIDENGYIIIPTPSSVKNGLYISEDDGEIRYYENNVAIHAGVVSDEFGNLYYIGSSTTAIKRAICGISKSEANNLIEPGIYEIDSYGVIRV